MTKVGPITRYGPLKDTYCSPLLIYTYRMSTGTGDYKDLLYAARDGDLATVQHWINQGMDLNFLHAEFLFAPLHESLRYGHLDVSRLLLEHGANPNLQEGYSDLTPLKIAQANGDQASVDLLEQYGVVVDRSVRGKIGQTLFDFVTKLVAF